ncbi:MAG: HAMP domain-containing protein [Alphaproteobacteria bacterium]|nr:HAMP domain-containing protein [Alphaproteobacteria bacterium]
MNAFWKEIEREEQLSNLPPKLKASIQQARDAYFIRFRANRNDVIENLTGGNRARISEREWIRTSDFALRSISRISEIALDLTETYAAERAADAARHLYIAVFLMFLSVGLASFIALYVILRVIRPLKLITQTMKTVAGGDFEHQIPFKDRDDEIGQFAGTPGYFRPAPSRGYA